MGRKDRPQVLGYIRLLFCTSWLHLYIIPAVTMIISCVGSKCFMWVQSDNTSPQTLIVCLSIFGLRFTSEHYCETIPDASMCTTCKLKELGECVNFCLLKDRICWLNSSPLFPPMTGTEFIQLLEEI